jgi:hypothetical protein
MECDHVSTFSLVRIVQGCQHILTGTQEIALAQCVIDNKNVTLIDTPGFDDTYVASSIDAVLTTCSDSLN